VILLIRQRLLAYESYELRESWLAPRIWVIAVPWDEREGTRVWAFEFRAHSLGYLEESAF
jgi:hypothetical protein